MGRIAFGCAVVVGAVFVVAGAGKVAAGPRWPPQALALGAPRAVVPLVPWWELVVGASLLVGLAKPWPAVAATVTIAAFTALLLRVLRRGEHPPCACFGTWSAAPLGVRHVVRNVALLCLAVVSVTVSVVGR